MRDLGQRPPAFVRMPIGQPEEPCQAMPSGFPNVLPKFCSLHSVADRSFDVRHVAAPSIRASQP